MNTISDRFHAILRHFNLNYGQLGRIMGVQKQAVSNYINQGRLPARAPMKRLRDRLGISEEWLVMGKGEMLESDSSPSSDDEALNAMIQDAIGKIAQLEPGQLDYVLKFIDQVVLKKL
jgi:transcriptional regulator with XRE-family HTH domain